MLYTNAICHSSGWDPEHLLQKDTIITINFCIAVLTCQVLPLVFCMGRSFPSINHIPLILSASDTSATGSPIWDATKKVPRYVHQPGKRSLRSRSHAPTWSSCISMKATLDGSETRRSPVEVGSLSHYSQSFIHTRWWSPDFFHQQYQSLDISDSKKFDPPTQQLMFFLRICRRVNNMISSSIVSFLWSGNIHDS